VVTNSAIANEEVGAISEEGGGTTTTTTTTGDGTGSDYYDRGIGYRITTGGSSDGLFHLFPLQQEEGRGRRRRKG